MYEYCFNFHLYRFYAIVIPVFLLQIPLAREAQKLLYDSARGVRRKIENSDCLSSVKINVFRTGLNALYVCLHYASFKKVINANACQ